MMARKVRNNDRIEFALPIDSEGGVQCSEIGNPIAFFARL